jgi:hypothetical protein
MKRLLLLCVLLCPSLYAAEISLAWDSSTSTVDGYGIFHKDFQHPYDYNTPLWTGTGLSCTVTVASDRQTAFVARAFAYGPYDLQGNRTQEWSMDSNEVIAIPIVTKPAPPRNFVIKILQAIAHFFGRLFG